MITQIIVIFKKEFRQQYSLALAMLLFCFLIQLAVFATTSFPELFGHSRPSFFGIALLLTALYVGAAAAVSFSTEHDEKTFGFLRSLPVSPLTVMLGKAAWVVTGTIFVLICSMIPVVLSPSEITYWRNQDNWFDMGIVIINVSVWGFFWSPLCRKQIHAVLTTYACTALTVFLALLIAEHKIPIFNYSNGETFLKQITVIVGIAAVYSMLQWFKNVTYSKKTVNFLQNENVMFCHLPVQQTPFFALLYQSVWHSLVLLVCYIIAMIILCLLSLFFSFSSFDHATMFFLYGIIFLTIIGGGCIFGADQRNQSFRFLSRCGIAPGKIWWSRILPFGTVYFPILIFVVINEFVFLIPRVGNGRMEENEFIFTVAVTISSWLISFSVGAFISIYCRSMLVSVALTGMTSLLLFLWLAFGWLLCRFNPLWTTLPLAVMLLIASRLRVADWLRERQTWRSLLKPLIPFFITITIIIGTIPLVRIYSIPYVSLEEAETLLDKIPLTERLSPEERKKLFQETAARLTQKLNENDLDRIKDWKKCSFHIQNLLRRRDLKKFDNLTEEELKRYLKNKYTDTKEILQTMPLFETWILYDYEIKTRIINGGLENIRLPFDDSMTKNILKRCRYLTWEKTRLLRRFNYQLHYYIHSGKSTVGQSDYNKMLKMLKRVESSKGNFDVLPDEWYVQTVSYLYTIDLFRLQLVYTALHLWYLEHDYTLPETLDELVGTYLDEIPRDPQTGTIMEYYPQGNESLDLFNDSSLNHKPNSPYLKLEGNILDLSFFPESQPESQ
ncbi:MAG: hypothetical protein LBG58_15305 [Planctomycetaceae bacterium]|jgi:hypothetical protein|nr:hypothetical protein [Planctomycetaceae bacterium]